MVDGYARVERISFEAFNEVGDFFKAVEGYREHYECYPERVLVDKIYRNRETIAWRKERGIQITGPALGRPPQRQGNHKASEETGVPGYLRPEHC
jgi:hypothetical protein